MKKHIFHVCISVALFFLFTVIFTKAEGVTLIPYYVGASELTEGEGFKCIGVPITVTDIPEKVRAGDEISLTFKGETYTEYRIRLYYPTAFGLTEDSATVKSDGKGKFEAEVTVPDNADEGKIKVAVLSEKSHLLAELEIVP